MSSPTTSKTEAVIALLAGSLDVDEIEKILAGLPPEDLAEVQSLVQAELDQPFIPNAGPQTRAFESEADMLLYGGAAGGGKSALMIGAIARMHSSALVLRREATQLDGLVEFSRTIFAKIAGAKFTEQNKTWRWGERMDKILRFAGLKEEDDWRKYAGNARDCFAFDEAAEFTKSQVFSLIGWLRTVRPGQRCRIILATNPPRGGDGAWVLEEFAPWLDPMHPHPAKEGELRWAIVVAGETTWVDDDRHRYAHDGEVRLATDEEVARKDERDMLDRIVKPMSRTFIGARLNDNPYLRNTGYRAVLQGLPEPLRSQLLKGDFLAGREDHDWQVIPTEWVVAAQERWKAAPEKRRRMLAIAADVAIGGADNAMIGSLHHGWWFGPLHALRGIDVKSPTDIGRKLLELRQDGADVSVDLTGGWGSGVKAWLQEQQEIDCHGIVFNERSGGSTSDGKMGFVNLRAEMWWRLREALDPTNPNHEHMIALPPDARLLAELTTPRWELRGTDILIESKIDVRKRVGGSTDRADVVVMLWHRKDYATLRALERTPGWKRNDRDRRTVDDSGILNEW